MGSRALISCFQLQNSLTLLSAAPVHHNTRRSRVGCIHGGYQARRPQCAHAVPQLLHSRAHVPRITYFLILLEQAHTQKPPPAGATQ